MHSEGEQARGPYCLKADSTFGNAQNRADRSNPGEFIFKADRVHDHDLRVFAVNSKGMGLWTGLHAATRTFGLNKDHVRVRTHNLANVDGNADEVPGLAGTTTPTERTNVNQTQR